MAILFNFKSLWRPHLVRINENVDSGGESKKEVAELDHNPSPQRLVGQLTIAGEVVSDDDDDVVDAGRDNEHNINFPQQKKIPSEMEVAPTHKLFLLLTLWLHWFHRF